ncbi:MAG: DUF2079 domain-containing protein [Candidatus Omnitrophica bacterium]|nr:DUF2079 domain-containing protein [Candidatus Omnitrophota bacterium]
MDVFLCFGLGAGLSAQIVFYSLLLLNHVDPAFIIRVHLLCLGALIYFHRRGLGRFHFHRASLNQLLVLVVILFLVLFWAAVPALVRPWGDWDGWAYWNFHAKFLFQAGYGWRRIFEYNVQAHHPWALPLLNIWGWSFYGAVKQIVPMSVGLIFTAATAGLLISALKKYIPFGWAVLAGVFLVSVPIFIPHGTSQYADIEAAFFILLSSVLSVGLTGAVRPGAAALTGVCLGITACTKDNGTVAALLLLTVLIVRLLKSGSGRAVKPLCWGFVATGLAAALMRCFEVYNPLFDSYMTFWPGLWDWHKWGFMGQFAFFDLASPVWGGFWILVPAVFVMRARGWRRSGIGFLIPFMAAYVIFYLLIFAVSALGIKWLLDVAFERTLYLLLPTAVFMFFYALVRGKPAFAADKTARMLTGNSAFRILSISAAVYVLVFFSWCCLKYYGFDYNDFDLAQHDQIIWNILHGRIFNSVLGIPFLGNHVHFISFLAAPLYWLFPHPLFLLLLQTLFLAAGVFPLYALARRYLDDRLSLAVGLIYLLYPGLGFINLFEFHPPCFATFFLLCSAYYFYKEDFFRFNVFMFLTLICQENMPLIFVMWGVYAFLLRRPLKWSLWTSGVGLAYFLFCVKVVLPYFNRNIFDFYSIYAPLGNSVGQIAVFCLAHPLKTMAIMFEPHKLHYLYLLFESVSFIPFLSPLALLPALLIFVQHLLSNRIHEVSLHYHYTAELIPFIFVAFVFGLKRLSGWMPKINYWVLILGVVLLANAVRVNLALGPHFYFAADTRRILSDNSVGQKEYLIEKIPPGAPVVATFKFLPHLTHRKDLYSFHYVYSGFYTLSSKRFHLPDNIKYALIDFDDFLTFVGFYGPENYRNIDEFLNQGPWGAVAVQDTMVLFQKGVKSRYPLFDFIDAKTVVPHRLDVTVDNSVELLGYGLKRQEGRLRLDLYWKSLRPETKDVNLFIDFMDKNGRVIVRQLRPVCYRIWPTQAWIKGQYIEEHQYITLSPLLRARLKSLRIGFFDFYPRRALPTDSKGIWGTVMIDTLGK